MREIIKTHLPESSFWELEEKLQEAIHSGSKLKFNLLFSRLSRLAGKAPVQVAPELLKELQQTKEGLDLQGWTADRLCRVYVLTHLQEDTEQAYLDRIEQLFSIADVGELVALYSALPFYRYPEKWVWRTTEGIRSNMTDVFDAVALGNPYPARYLEEPAWNQMVLKALFMERPVYRIHGLDKRANAALARILGDYARERWAAGRTVSPELWRCYGKFIDDRNIEHIGHLISGSDPFKEEAAVLVCYDSDHPGSKQILHRFPEIYARVRSGELTWEQLGKRAAMLNG